MKKAVMNALGIIGLTLALPSLAEPVRNCYVEVAVSTPPVTIEQSVAFNVTSDSYSNNSITLKGGSAPRHIENLECSATINYTISATLYSTPSNLNSIANDVKPVGQCQLKAGPIAMRFPGDSISVVFPQDFVCNN
ncbi:hypothetical protein [Legionella waltersii]|uniref:Uncharacterized protein n=1 Tax=Legionella waltersii TaxID=66969 RepID=A0A0W1A1Q9_9GAMM|nr:hypothetical protein [Legionella waltersii]KTD75297.1 hypothetical protein Lwal_3338 [Legionella waltersii]SNV06995.1 Uncharacterised protein [Legionella waltersii]